MSKYQVKVKPECHHKSTGHFNPVNGFTEYIPDVPLCGEKNYMFASADWSAVDCPKCLALREKHEKEIADMYRSEAML